MSDISELESRLTAALDRIAWSVENGVANAPASAGAAQDGMTAGAGLASGMNDSELAEELEVERATNERLSAAREKHVARIERLEIRVTRLADRLEKTDLENKRLENLVGQLSRNNNVLREANAAHQGAGIAADAGMTAQLEHLEALREADRNELDEIMAELAPILKEA